MTDNQDFQEFYRREIQPLLDGIEEERLKGLSSLKAYVKGAIIFSIFSLMIAFIFFPIHAIFLAFALFILGTIPAIIIMKKFSTVGKKTILPKMLSFFGKFYYRDEPVFNDEDFETFKKIGSGHPASYTVEDNIMGNKNDLMIKIANVMSVKTSKRHNSSFDGLLIKISFNKSFKGKTIICKDLGTAGNFLQKNIVSLENIKLEDPVFENKFEVYGTDQVEARYILTTAFMERFLKLDSLSTRTVTCAFANQNMYLAIPKGGDSLSTGFLFTNSYSPESIFQVFNQLCEIFEIIEILKLNENIGL